MAQQITAIRPQLKRKNRVSIFLDDAFAFGLMLDVAENLRVGQILSPDEIELLQNQELLASTKQLILNYISYRPRSIREVRQHLRKKEVPAAIVTAVVDDLTERKYLDDIAFAHYWVEQRETFKPRSHIALRQELAQKGIDSSIIDELLVDVDQTTAAREVAVKKGRHWGHLEKDVFHKKMMGFLSRRGFPYHIIRDIIPELWDEITVSAQDNN